MFPSFGFKPLNLSEIQFFDNSITYLVGTILYIWAPGKCKAVDLKTEISKIDFNINHIISLNLTPKPIISVIDRKSLEIIKKLDGQSELFAIEDGFISIGQKSILYDQEFCPTLLPSPSTMYLNFKTHFVLHFQDEFHLYNAKGESLYKSKDKIGIIDNDKFFLKQNEIVLVHHLNHDTPVTKRKCEGDLASIKGVLLHFHDCQIFSIYPINKRLILTVSFIDYKVSTYLILTDGFKIYIYAVQNLLDDVNLIQLKVLEFPLFKYFESDYQIVMNCNYVCMFTSSIISVLDLTGLQFSTAKNQFLTKFDCLTNTQLLVSHDNSQMNTFIIQNGSVFQTASYYIKGKSDLNIYSSILMSTSDKYVLFRSLYDFDIIAQYPFKTFENLVLRVIGSYLISYSEKTVTVYRLYTFKKQEEFICDKKVLDVYYCDFGLFILTASTFYQVEKHDVLLEYTINGSFNKFVLDIYDCVRGHAMLMGGNNYLLLYFGIVNRRCVIDHSKSEFYDLPNYSTVNWTVRGNILLHADDNFFIYTRKPNELNSLLTSPLVSELVAEQELRLKNKQSDLDLQLEYDFSFLQDSLESKMKEFLNTASNQISVNMDRFRSLLENQKTICNQSNFLFLSVKSKHASKLSKLRSEFDENIFKIVAGSDDLEKDCRKVILKYKDNIDQSLDNMKGERKRKLEHLSAERLKIQNSRNLQMQSLNSKISSFDMQLCLEEMEYEDAMENAKLNFDSLYNTKKQELYPLKSILTITEKKKFSLIHQLDLSKIKRSRLDSTKTELHQKLHRLRHDIIDSLKNVINFDLVFRSKIKIVN
eukprot:NODE_49_length_31687_cov_0.791123.p3 type:complete len:814 gc:universal NODE_49_length_31687_cov_0.791123:4384-6825(+)